MPETHEEAIVGHFGRVLFDTSRHFEHIDSVSGITGDMRRILTIAIDRYEMREDKQAILNRKRFVFDGQRYGRKCSMALKLVDEGKGVYSLVLKGRAEN